MALLKNKKIKIAVSATIILVVVFSFFRNTPSVSASWPSFKEIFNAGTCLAGNVAGCSATASSVSDKVTGAVAKKGLSSMAQGAWGIVLQVVASVMYAIIYLEGMTMTALIRLIQIGMDISSLPLFVTEEWKIVRNFSNMFFILIMIIMAFSTIFDVGSTFGWTGYDVKSLLGKLIIAAVLINFSLAIGQGLVGAFDKVNRVLMYSIGNFGDQMTVMINPGNFLTDYLPPASSAVNSAQGAVGIPTPVPMAIPQVPSRISTEPGALIPQMFFTIIIMTFVTLSLFVVGVVVLARIPIIWLLLIFSPLAWLSSILPATKGLNKRWWDQFIRWNTFLPVFLLVLYFGLSIHAGLMQSTENINGASKELIGVASYTFNSIFGYAVVIFTLIGGVGMAIKGGVIAGTSGLGAAQWAQQKVQDYSGYSAAKAAISQKYSQAVTEPGKQRQERWQARFGQALGVKGTSYTATSERQRVGRIDLLKKGLEGYAPDDLRTLAGKGGEQGIAAAYKLQEMGILDKETAKNTLLKLGPATIGGQSFASKLDFEKMSKAERDDIEGLVVGIEAKRKLIEARLAKGDVKDVAKMVDLVTKSGVFTSAGDRKAALDKALDEAGIVKVATAKNKIDPSVDRAKEISKGLSKAAASDIVKLADDLDDTDVRNALIERMRDPKFTKDVLIKAGSKRGQFDGIIKDIRVRNAEVLEAQIQELEIKAKESGLNSSQQERIGAAIKKLNDKKEDALLGLEELNKNKRESGPKAPESKFSKGGGI